MVFLLKPLIPNPISTFLLILKIIQDFSLYGQISSENYRQQKSNTKSDRSTDNET